MNRGLVLHVLGLLSLVVAATMVAPLGIAMLGEANVKTSACMTWSFLGTIAIAVAFGLVATRLTRIHRGDTPRPAEGFAVAALGWILTALLGALPFWFSGAAGFTDSVFESMSGFTTTGSSIFGTLASDGGNGLIEALPASLLFWRSLTHWLGGMGIVVLSLAVLPALGAGGYQVFAAEVPGPTAERILPRVRDTAAILWGVYILLTVAEAALLCLGDMPLFDSICHTFGTMATGGFSTKDASIKAYATDPNGLYFEIVIDVFMFLAGCNFLLHYRALHGDVRAHVRDGEFRFYAGSVAAAILAITVLTRLAGIPGGGYDTVGTALRKSVFQVISITTTTGFCTANFDLWPGAARAIMVLMMFLGGCAGSTGGGLKMVRVQMSFKVVARELRQIVHPRAVLVVKTGKTPVQEALLARIILFVVVYIMIFIGAVILVTVLNFTHAPPTEHAPTPTTERTVSISAVSEPAPPEDITCVSPRDAEMVTAFTAVAATLNNIGPGLAGVGATNNFSLLNQAVKWVLILCMLIGRLEVFAVVVTFLPFTRRI